MGDVTGIIYLPTDQKVSGTIPRVTDKKSELKELGMTLPR